MLKNTLPTGICILTGCLALSGQSLVVGFDDLVLTTPPAMSYSEGGIYYNGSDGAGGFTSNGVQFENLYNADWGTWSGWAYSTTTDVTTEGFGNQYSAFTGGALSGKSYGVAYLDAFNGLNPIYIDLPAGWTNPQSIAVANTTYAALTIQNGNPFAAAFAQGDYFKLTVQGVGTGDTVLGTIVHYLADFRGTEETHTIQDAWASLDLSGFGAGVERLSFLLESSDTGIYGMNTPAYIAVDDLTLNAVAVPEPGTVALIMGLLALATVLRRRR